MTNSVNCMEFYHENEAEQFVFYRIPKLLFKDERFSKISSDAKLLYALLLDRMSLSQKNGWVDENKRVYIYFSVQEIMEELNIGSEKCTKIMAELDDKKGCGLIQRKRQGQGKPSKIYVMKFTSPQGDNVNHTAEPDLSDEDDLEIPQRITLQKNGKSNFQTFENRISKNSETETLDFRKSKCNYNKDNNTEIIDNEYSDTYPILSNRESVRKTGGNEMDAIRERDSYREILCDNIDYDILSVNYEHDDIDGIVEIMVDAICSRKDFLTISCDEIPKETVKSRLLKLDSGHIEYVIECLKKNTTKVRNIKSYILTALYNSYTTIDHYYRAEVNHDLYG